MQNILSLVSSAAVHPKFGHGAWASILSECENGTVEDRAGFQPLGWIVERIRGRWPGPGIGRGVAPSENRVVRISFSALMLKRWLGTNRACGLGDAPVFQQHAV